MTTNFIILILALFALVQGASFSSRYAERIADSFRMSKYLVGFLVVSFVAVLPETFIAISAAWNGEPSLGIGTIFGSNVIDLTLVMAILIFVAKKRGLKVEKDILNKLALYPLFLTVPLLLGTDGAFSREEGLVLIIVGVIFYYYLFRKNVSIAHKPADRKYRLKNIVLFLLSIVLLLGAAHFTSASAVNLAHSLNMSPILIGILIVSFGTTLPELFFSARAVKDKRDALAIGNVLGSVLADVTIVVGLLAVIHPFNFPRSIAYLTAGFMVTASIVLLVFMRSKQRLDYKHALVLVGVWAVYILAELAASQTL